MSFLRNIFAFAVVAALVVTISVGCSSKSKSDSGGGTPGSTPLISITAPTESAALTGKMISINVAITDWTLAEGGNNYHYFIDSVDMGTRYTDVNFWILGSSIGNGSHTLSVKLADDTDTFIGVEDMVNFSWNGTGIGPGPIPYPLPTITR